MYFSNSRTIIFLLLMLSAGTQMAIILSLCVRQSLTGGIPPKFLGLHEGTRERDIVGRDWKCHYTAYCRRVILASSLQLLCCFGGKLNCPYGMGHSSRLFICALGTELLPRSSWVGQPLCPKWVFLCGGGNSGGHQNFLPWKSSWWRQVWRLLFRLLSHRSCRYWSKVRPLVLALSHLGNR